MIKFTAETVGNLYIGTFKPGDEELYKVYGANYWFVPKEERTEDMKSAALWYMVTENIKDILKYADGYKIEVTKDGQEITLEELKALMA